MLRLVVRRGPAVALKARVDGVPGADQQCVLNYDPAPPGTPDRLQDERAGEVPAALGHHQVGRPHPKAAGGSVEDGAENAGRVRAREAEPLDVPAGRDQDVRLAVGKECVVGDRGKRTGSTPATAGDFRFCPGFDQGAGAVWMAGAVRALGYTLTHRVSTQPPGGEDSTASRAPTAMPVSRTLPHPSVRCRFSMR